MEDLFKSTHNLEFLSRIWNIGSIISPESEIYEYKVGDIHGLYRFDNKNRYLIINSVINDNPGNGHFKDLMDWLEFSCRNCKYSLVFEKIFNPRLIKILIHYGFERLEDDCMIKRVPDQNPSKP